MSWQSGFVDGSMEKDGPFPAENTAPFMRPTPSPSSTKIDPDFGSINRLHFRSVKLTVCGAVDSVAIRFSIKGLPDSQESLLQMLQNQLQPALMHRRQKAVDEPIRNYNRPLDTVVAGLLTWMKVIRIERVPRMGLPVLAR